MENQILIALKNNKLLKNILFDDLNLSNIKGDLLTISEGEILFREGNDSDYLYLVVSGEINLLRKRQGSKATSLLFFDHDFLGCEEFIESSKRQATAVALRDSYIIALTKDEVDNLIDQNDEILHNIYEAINANDMNNIDADVDLPSTQPVDFTSSESIKPSDNSFASKVFQGSTPDTSLANETVESDNEEPLSEVEENNFNDSKEEDDLLSGYSEEDDQSFIKPNFNLPSSEISSEELDEIVPELPEQNMETNKFPSEEIQTEIDEQKIDDIIISEDNSSDTIVDELKESIDEFKPEIEKETEDLLNVYDEEVTESDLNSITPNNLDELNSLDEEKPKEIIEEDVINNSQDDDEFLLNQSLQEIVEAQVPMIDTDQEDDTVSSLNEEEVDEILTTDNNLITDDGLPESNFDSIETNETETSFEAEERQSIPDEETVSDDYSTFTPGESQLTYDDDPIEESEPDITTITSTQETTASVEKSHDEIDQQTNIEETKEIENVFVSEEHEIDNKKYDDVFSIKDEIVEQDKIVDQPLNDITQAQDTDETSDIEQVKEDLPDDIFNNYEDDKPLEPLIPSSYRVKFNQEDEKTDETNDQQPSEMINPEEDKKEELSEEYTPPVVSDDDFDLDERFGKIDPFYDAELENQKNDEAVNEPLESVQDINDKTETSETGFIEAEPFTTPLPEEEEDSIILTSEVIEEEQFSTVENNEIESVELKEKTDGDSLNVVDELIDVDDSKAEVPLIITHSELPIEDKAIETSECEETVILLEKINKAAEQVNSNIQIDEVLKNIVNAAVELTRADRGTLYIVDKNRNELWSKVAMGNEFKEIKLQIGEGIAGWVAQNGEVINLDKVQDDPRFNTSFDKTSGYETKSMLCFPIKDKQSEVVGVVQLLNSKGGSFTKLDEEFLESLSIHAAMALQNAGLVEKLLTTERVSSLGKMANFLIQDIKKPIMVSKRYAEHLKSKSLDQEVTRVVDMLLDQLNHIADLVQSTSSYSEGQIVLRSVVSKLNETLDDYINRLDSLLRASACKLTKKYDNELNVKVSEKQFYQAIQSIIKNACQAMPEGGNIFLTTEKVDDRVLIKIKDQGLGIPDSLHDKIFEPFMTHGKKDATGLGLSITKKIIEEHGGKISVDSNVGDGTTFVIDLPIVYAL